MVVRRAVRTLLVLPLMFATGCSVARAHWPLDGNPICIAPCDQVVLSSVADDQGGMYLAWDDNRTCGNKLVYLQHVDGSGATFPGWPEFGRPVCSSTVGQSTPMLVADGHDGVFVVWRDYRTGLSIFAERFAPEGKPLWDPAGVAVCDAGDFRDAAGVLADGDGGVYVTWLDHRLGLHRGPPSHDPLFNIYAQHIVANGARAWGAMGVAVSGDVVYLPATVLRSDGTGTLITWNNGSRRQLLDASGTPLLGADGVSAAMGSLLASDGGGVIGVFGRSAADGGSAVLRAQRTDATGASLWGADGKQFAEILSASGFDQNPKSLIADGAGGAYVAWSDRRNGDDRDVYLQRLDAAGNIAPGWPANGIDLSPVAGPQDTPRLITAGGGGCIAVWSDGRNAATGLDIAAQCVTSAGVVAPGWTPGGTLVCSVAGDQYGSQLASDGAGGALISWQDWRADGDVYAQHIGFSGVLGDQAGVAGVEPPASAKFAIGAVYPNPSHAASLRVSLSLPNGEPARLSLIDAQGRLVARQVVQIAGGGRRTILLDSPGRVPSGIYRLRLEQFGRAISRSLAIVK